MLADLTAKQGVHDTMIGAWARQAPDEMASPFVLGMEKSL